MPRSESYGTVADSSAVDPHRPAFDGQRRLVACGPAHLQELIDQYLGRPFDDEKLWAHVLVRAGRQAGRHADPDDILDVTGLTREQLRKAVRWQSIWLSWTSGPGVDGGA